MKWLYASLLFSIVLLSASYGQRTRIRIDSLKHVLALSPPDTSRVLLLTRLANNYFYSSPDSSLMMAQQGRQLAQKLNFVKGEISGLIAISAVMRNKGELPQALAYAFDALNIAKADHQRREEAETLNTIGNIYYDLGEYQQAINYYQQSKNVAEAFSYVGGVARTLTTIARSYLNLNRLDSARLVNQQAYQLVNHRSGGFAFTIMLAVLNNFGQLEARSGNSQKALHFYREALRLTYSDENIQIRSTVQFYMAELFEHTNQPDSVLKYAHQALISSQQQGYKLRILSVSNLLTRIYKARNNLDSAFKFQEIARVVNDSLFGPKKFQRLQRLTLTQQQRQQALVVQQKEYQNRVRFYGLLAGLSIVLLLAFVLWRNNRQKHKANVVLEKTLTELKSTQTQLIQREKMASLGELTAGIAHEIQNPLNFVNNFAELSTELVDELTQELDQGQPQEAKAIASDLTQNLQKITHHGKRASNIVKGMLEHSRTSTGQKEPTDLNTLADEYLRLAYQGWQAKDQTVTCELITDFTPNLPLMNVAPQEIGRVLLNLYSNAFYAVSQKQRTVLPDYQPTVTITTRFIPHSPERAQSIAQSNGLGTDAGIMGTRVNVMGTGAGIMGTEPSRIEIRVKDNGAGIPDAIKAKIFQPFFTTKPTGEGTGLGLSLSYDVVTKGHGGTLDVKTVSGEFTEFIIALPIGE